MIYCEVLNKWELAIMVYLILVLTSNLNDVISYNSFFFFSGHCLMESMKKNHLNKSQNLNWYGREKTSKPDANGHDLFNDNLRYVIRM